MKRKIISTLLVLTLLLPLLLVTGCSAKKETPFTLPSYSTMKPFVFKDKTYERTQTVNGVTTKTEFKLALDNDKYELYFSEGILEVALINKQTGAVWFSNPSEADRNNGGGLQSEMSSQLQLFYVNKKNNSQGFKNTYSDCVKMGDPNATTKQYYIIDNDGKLRIIYVMGLVRKEFAIPTVLTSDKFDELTQKMKADNKSTASLPYVKITPKDWTNATDSQKQRYSDVVPLIEENMKNNQTLYIIADKTLWNNPSNMAKVEDILKTYLNFDIAQRDEINNQFGVVPDVPDVFSVPIDYSLDENGLNVSIKNQDISYNSNTYEISTIDVLKYFGAGDNNEKGYMFVPDGSGALINFNNGKTQINDPVKVPIYGLDKGRERETAPFMNQQGYLPVFGIKKADSALFAIMESGASVATVTADIAGKNSVAMDKNTVFPSYKLVDFQELSFVSTNMTLRVYQQKRVSSDINIKYTILPKEKADYSGMAEFYRNYLYANGVLKPSTLTNQTPFNLELIGGCSEKSAFLGISYDKMYALTTFGQAKSIIDQLVAKGIMNISISYKGWANGGLRNTAFNKIQVLSDLGGTNGLKDLMAYAQGKGVTIYPEAELIYVYQDKLFGDNFSSLADSSRMLNRKIAVNTQYDIVSQQSVARNSSTLVGPTKLKQFVPSLIKSFDNLGIKSISLGGISSNLASDFKLQDFYDREQVMNEYTNDIKQFKDDGMSLMGKGVNYYMLNAVDKIFEIPNTSSKFVLADESVPFYQMVIHGSIQYSGEAVNLNGDTKTVFLQAVEAGAGLYYRWDYIPNDQLKDIHFQGIYSLNYTPWLDEAADFYKRYNDLLGSTTNQKMIHHDILTEGVVKITYEKGTVVYVNYNNTDYTANGTVVPARDFAVVKGGNQ